MKISDIYINPKNPRFIKDINFKKLCRSIEEFPKMMKLRPIIIDNDGVILGGNMRFRALKKLGYKEIPDEWVKKASELTEDEKKRFIIQDNISVGEWDIEKLINEWDEEILDKLELNFADKVKLKLSFLLMNLKHLILYKRDYLTI